MGGHRATMEQRLCYVEQAIGDSADKHARGLEQLKLSHEKHAAILNRAGQSSEKHATIEQRLDELERYVGDSADKHFKELEEMKKVHGSHAERMQGFHTHHGTMAERLQRVESCLDEIETSVA